MPITNTVSPWATAAVQSGSSGAAPAASATGVTALLVGDSRTAQNYILHYISSISRTNGVVTVKFTGGALDGGFYYLWKGATVQVENVQEDVRGKRVITGGTGTVWTFDAPGPDFAEYTPTGTPHVMNLSHYSTTGYFVRANARSMGKFDLVDVVASVGRATDEMVARLPEALSSTAQLAFVWGGINDINGGKAWGPIFTNLKTICLALRDAGKQVFLLTEIPLYGGNNTTARATTIALLNVAIRKFARETPGIRLVDAYAPLVNSVNPASPGEIKQYHLSTDNLHPSSRGADEIAKVVVAATSHIPLIDTRMTSSSEKYGTTSLSTDILDSAPFAAGAVDVPYAGSQVGSGYTGIKEGNSGAVFSVVPRADGFGMNNKVVYTPTSGSDGARWLSANVGGVRLKANCKIYSEVSVKLTGAVAGLSRAIRHQYVVALPGGGYGAASALADAGETALYLPQEDAELVLRTPTVAWSNPVNLFALTGASSAGASASQVTFEMGRAKVDLQPI